MSIKSHVCPKHGETTAYVYPARPGAKRRGKFQRHCVECRSETVQRDWRRIKNEIVAAYGGACQCCGEKNPGFLTMDHTDGGGSKQRKSGMRGWTFYQWLKRNNYPKNGFRLLCYNCNCARGQYGTCPHTWP